MGGGVRKELTKTLEGVEDPCKADETSKVSSPLPRHTNKKRDAKKYAHLDQGGC